MTLSSIESLNTMCRHLACQEGRIEDVLLLLRQGAHVEHHNKVASSNFSYCSVHDYFCSGYYNIHNC